MNAPDSESKRKAGKGMATFNCVPKYTLVKIKGLITVHPWSVEMV